MLELSAPINKVKTTIKLSGSKSISNRLLIIKEVLDIDLILHNTSNSEDTQLLQKALEQLKIGETTIDIGHAGSDMRFLTALLAIKNGSWVLTGSERMKQRPIGELVASLRSLGANITYSEKEGFPPLQIDGHSLSGGKIIINGSVSSQFISALLLISPKLEKGLEINIAGTIVSQPYIEMTIELLKQFGVKINSSGSSIYVHPFKKTISLPSTFTVESDWSSASYWYSICALSPGAEIELSFLNAQSLQADSVLPTLFESLGVKTIFNGQTVLLTNSGTPLPEFEHDFTECPDIAQTLAVTCFALGIKATLTGLKTLRIKETDRIAALKTEIEKFGVSVQTTEGSIHIPKNSIFDDPGTFHAGLNISTYQDHRMAMAFAPLSLVCKKLKIQDPDVVNKSYPTFWEDLKSAGFNVNLQP